MISSVRIPLSAWLYLLFFLFVLSFAGSIVHSRCPIKCQNDFPSSVINVIRETTIKKRIFYDPAACGIAMPVSLLMLPYASVPSSTVLTHYPMSVDLDIRIMLPKACYLHTSEITLKIGSGWTISDTSGSSPL